MISPYVVPGLKFREDIERKCLNADIIVDVVVDYFGTNKDVLICKKRSKRNVEIRQICMYFLTKNTNLTLTEISKLFLRDHTTVVHGRDKILKELKNNNIYISTHVLKIDKLLTSKSWM